MNTIKKVRIDKWLWTVRIYKSRTLATKACKAGNVKIGPKTVKPSAFVYVDDHIYVKRLGFNLEFIVRQLLKSRVSAVLAAPCYEDKTSQEELNKYKSWFIGKAAPERREKGAGRPTKRERRELDEFKEDRWWAYLEEE